MNLTCGGGSSTSFSRALKPCRGHHVRLVDDVDLVAAGDRGEERPLPQVPGVVDTTVAGRVDLDHVDAAGPTAGQVHAGHALPARLRSRTVLAVQRAGQDAGRRRLATAPRAGEQVGVVDPVVGQRPLQRLGDVLLADDVGERVRPVAPVQSERRRSGAAPRTPARRRGPRPGCIPASGGSRGVVPLRRSRAASSTSSSPGSATPCTLCPAAETRHGPRDSAGGHPRRHLGLDVPAVARRLLPARAAAARRAGLRRRADEQSWRSTAASTRCSGGRRTRRGRRRCPTTSSSRSRAAGSSPT